ncbi:MAG: hypothetical protein R2761_14210 [Acidimicrobiales bacterium]
MNRPGLRPNRKMLRRAVPVACALLVTLAAAGCGSSSSSTDTGDSPTTVPAAAGADGTSAPQSGGAGF